jgi:hypothetical protein
MHIEWLLMSMTTQRMKISKSPPVHIPMRSLLPLGIRFRALHAPWNDLHLIREMRKTQTKVHEGDDNGLLVIYIYPHDGFIY